MTTSPDIPEMPDMPTDEKLVQDMLGAIDAEKLSTLRFRFSTYQQHDPEFPTAVLAYITGQLGMVVWNLDVGQQNDYHVHPSTEHVHILLEGEFEYQLGDEPPFRCSVGEAVMVPAGVPHGIRNVGDVPASYLAVTSPGPYEKIRLARPAS